MTVTQGSFSASSCALFFSVSKSRIENPLFWSALQSQTAIGVPPMMTTERLPASFVRKNLRASWKTSELATSKTSSPSSTVESPLGRYVSPFRMIAARRAPPGSLTSD